MPPHPSLPVATEPGGSALRRLTDAKLHHLAGRMDEALEGFATAVDEAEGDGDRTLKAECYRYMALIHHHRGEPLAAWDLCRQSMELARTAGDTSLTAEALNVLAGFECEAGATQSARERYVEALALSNGVPALVARVEQNLGIVANIRGELAVARTHYQRSLAAYESAGDLRGCAIAHHNLGMLCADQELWMEANKHYDLCLELATSAGDVHLQGLCHLNHAEIHFAHARYDVASAQAEAALATFIQLESRIDQADAYRVLGMILRENRRPALAESRLRSAMEIAAGTGAALGEGEAARELGGLYQTTGRKPDALRMYVRARELFTRVGAQRDLDDIVRRAESLATA